MLYWVAKVFSTIFLRVFYRIEVKGLKNIPRNKPIIIAANHVNAFIDPSVIGIVVPQKVRFFARSDVFKSPFAKKVLDSLNISPMYRILEGYSEVKKNEQTFEECKKLLSQNKTILLFPEGLCVLEKRLRKLKKGLARIIFSTEETFDFKKGVFVIPMGLNYSKANEFGSKLFMNIGKPIHISDYEQQYKEDKVKAINEFTKELEIKMAELMVIVEKPENDEVYEAAIEMFEESPKNAETEHEQNCEIAGIINHYDKNPNEEFEKFKSSIHTYMRELKKIKIDDATVRKRLSGEINFFHSLVDSIMLAIGFPLFTVGALLNYPPYFLAKRMTDKKIKNIDFYASIYANTAMGLWLLFYTIQLITVGLIFRNWTILNLYALLIPVCGLFFIKYYNYVKSVQKKWRLATLTENQVAELMKQKGEIEILMKGLENTFDSL